MLIIRSIFKQLDWLLIIIRINITDKINSMLHFDGYSRGFEFEIQ